jgi:trehalose synthase-fused probable maltokinase
MLQAFVPNDGDGWDRFRRTARELLDGALAGDRPPPPAAPADPIDAAWSAPPSDVPPALGAAIDDAVRLGRRTAEMHLALAADRRTPDLAPVPMSRQYLEGLAESMSRHARSVLDLLGSRVHLVPKAAAAAASAALAGGHALVERFGEVARLGTRAARIRCHGDYHLGQTLHAGGDFVILDFEGEPLRPLAERREKASPLKDVAGMLRSFGYAARTVAADVATEQGSGAIAPLMAWAETWERCLGGAFLREYLAVARNAPFLPEEDDLRVLLGAFVLDKLFYELHYELNNRPDWVSIPLDGLRAVAGGGSGRRGESG